nr:hypothetical protein [Tanacetum cinerariifolium]
MTAMLKQLQANPPPAQVKAVEEICVTCGGAHPYYQCLAAGGNTFPEFRDNIQGSVSAVADNYNQGNLGYRPQGVANQIRPPGFAQPNVQNNQNRFGQPQGFNRGTNFNQEQPYQATTQSNQNFHLNELEKIKRMNNVSLKAMQNQIDMVKNEPRSGSLPGNTVANPKGELKSITIRSGLVINGPTVPTPPKSVTPEEDECVEETYTDPDLADGVSNDGPSIPPLVVENEPEATKDTMIPTNNGTTEDVQPQAAPSKPVTSEPANTPVSASKPNPQASIPYPSRRNDERNREKAKDQIEKFYQIFKDMSFEISFTNALILMPKFASTLKALIGNKEKLSEMARTPLNEHCSAVLLKKLLEKLDFDADPRIPLILRRSFLKTERALIDVFEGELTLRVGKEAITFNLDQTSRYSSNYNDMTANRIDVIDMACEEYSQKVLGFSDTVSSGNPTPFYDPTVSATSPTLTPFGDSAKTKKSSVDEPPVVELKALPPHLEYAFLEGDDKSSSKLSRDQTSNPTSSTNPTSKGRIRRSSKQKVENSNFEENLPPIATMTDNRTMAEMLRAPTEWCTEAIVVPSILAEQFEFKHSLINMMTSEQFFGLKKDNPHDHIR